MIADPGRRRCASFEARLVEQGSVVTVLRDVLEDGTAPGALPSRVKIIEIRRR